jgi:hypothetical protein
LRSPPGVSGSEVVNAATVAPVGMNVRPLIVSAERWIGSRQTWSSGRARLSHSRQKRVVVASRAVASSTSVGEASSSAHESEQNIASPACSTWRPRVRLPSMPSDRSVDSRIVWPAPLASAACRSSPTSDHSAGVRP